MNRVDLGLRAWKCNHYHVFFVIEYKATNGKISFLEKRDFLPYIWHM